MDLVEALRYLVVALPPLRPEVAREGADLVRRDERERRALRAGGPDLELLLLLERTEEECLRRERHARGGEEPIDDGPPGLHRAARALVRGHVAIGPPRRGPADPRALGCRRGR